jgi:hypothetical protein
MPCAVRYAWKHSRRSLIITLPYGSPRTRFICEGHFPAMYDRIALFHGDVEKRIE